MCLNIGTPKNINFPFETNGKFMILGVPILKHFRVLLYRTYYCQVQTAPYWPKALPIPYVCLSLDTETVNYDHYLRLGGALNFEFSIKKKKKKIYIQLGGPLKLFTSSKGYLSNTPEQPFKSEP